MAPDGAAVVFLHQTARINVEAKPNDTHRVLHHVSQLGCSRLTSFYKWVDVLYT